MAQQHCAETPVTDAEWQALADALRSEVEARRRLLEQLAR